MSPRGDGMFWAGSIEQSGYHARVQERWVPILLSVGYNNSVKIYARLGPCRDHTFAVVRSVNDAMALLEQEHRSNPKRMKAAKA